LNIGASSADGIALDEHVQRLGARTRGRQAPSVFHIDQGGFLDEGPQKVQRHLGKEGHRRKLCERRGARAVAHERLRERWSFDKLGVRDVERDVLRLFWFREPGFVRRRGPVGNQRQRIRDEALRVGWRSFGIGFGLLVRRNDHGSILTMEPTGRCWVYAFEDLALARVDRQDQFRHRGGASHEAFGRV
jgi:hypothetical protein